MKPNNHIKNDILNWLCRNQQLTRTEYVQNRNLRPASVFKAIDELKNEGMVIEPDRKGRKTGRRSPPIYMNPDYCWVVGLDFQCRKTLGVILSFTGKPLIKVEISNGRRESLQDSLDEIHTVLRRLQSKAGKGWQRVRGIGFADPGLVDIVRKISLRAVNVPGWMDLDIGNTLKTYIPMENLVIPEMLARTFHEYTVRYPNPPASLFHMNMGVGIGGGFIQDNKLFIGDSFHGMEIGHIITSPDGPQCQCGNRGCLESIAGEEGIKRKIRELTDNGVDTRLNADDFSLETFAEQAKTDKAGGILANEICENISLALSTVVTLLNPALIVLNGELTQLGETMITSIKQMLTMHCLPGAIHDLNLEISEQNKYTAAIGAALLMREQVLFPDSNCLTSNNYRQHKEY